MLAYKFARPNENTDDANQEIENATQKATSKCFSDIFMRKIVAVFFSSKKLNY